MEEYGIMEYLELTITRCGQWTGNGKFIWSGLIRGFQLEFIFIKQKLSEVISQGSSGLVVKDAGVRYGIPWFELW